MIFDGNLNDMNGDFEQMLNNHPINVFTKLLAEDPDSKLYRKCLDEEIRSAADSCINEMSEEQIIFFEMLNNLIIAPMLSNDDNGFDEETRIRMRTINEIFEEIHRRRQ